MTEWIPIQSVIIQETAKPGVRFVFHEYNCKPNWTTQLSINHKNYNFQGKKNN